ncbi:MAG: methanogenesis marker 2 protein [Methanothrix sp.]|nr:methanogenesis marker 2 protein [Methanothrix sp.]
MNLQSLASELQGFVGITRKKTIGNLIQFFPIESERIIASFGEDAAVIDDGEEVMLLAADGIWSKLMEADPEWSGYCSVLVNVHDIAAMGGWPVAMVDILSVNDPTIAEAVLKGMKKGIEKFNVPIIGGHLHPDTPYSALDVAILGKARKDAVILSSTARADEVVIAAADMDGAAHPRFSINFDSTSFKDRKILLTQLGAMRELGEAGLVKAGKDISNPGLLGTLGMLLETSGVGAKVDLDKIPVPKSLDLLSWLKMYPGMGFIVTCKPENAERVVEVFQRHHLTAAVIGKVTEERKLVIRSRSEEAVLFDLTKECVTGIR